MLKLKPTSVHDAAANRLDPALNTWFREYSVRSDPRLQPALDALLVTVRAKRRRIRDAIAAGWEFRVLCYGQVDPHQSVTLEPFNAVVLGELGITLQVFVA